MATTTLNFAAQVDAWVRETEVRMLAVFRTAAQFVVEDVLDRTPVDTGYLRASLTVTTTGPLPIRENAQPAEGQTYTVQPYALSIAGAEIGDTVFASFVAGYAGHVEYGAKGRAGRAMVRLAAQNWPVHVDRAVAAAKARSGA
ncbi:MAG TPA: HK97 gp10 family phage protein [Mesorhizobium sp.]|nr:HK97 gp10 family phage protein [Mesorhizobium sp.]